GPGAAYQLAPPRVVTFAPAGRLLPHPAQVAAQLRGTPQLRDRRVQCRQRLVGVCGVDHAVALRADQFDVLRRAALLARQAVVAGQLPAGGAPAAQGTGDGPRLLHEGATTPGGAPQPGQPPARVPEPPADPV